MFRIVFFYFFDENEYKTAFGVQKGSESVMRKTSQSHDSWGIQDCNKKNQKKFFFNNENLY